MVGGIGSDEGGAESGRAPRRSTARRPAQNARQLRHGAPYSFRLGFLPAVIAALLLASTVGACSLVNAVAATRVDQKSYTVGATVQLVVTTFNGEVNVTAGGDGTLSAKVTARGSGGTQDAAQRDLANVAVDFAQNGDAVTVTAHRTDNPVSLNNSGADVEISLPRSSSLDLTTSNGRVQAVNVIGSIQVRTSNGDVVTREGHDVTVETSNGSVTASDTAGALDLRTSNGAVDVLNATDVVATIQTSNGHVAFNGTLAAGSHRMETSNASLSIALPSGATFSIDGHTSNGNVSSDFPLTVTKDSLSGAVGSGGPSIAATTSNGNLSLTRLAP